MWRWISSKREAAASWIVLGLALSLYAGLAFDTARSTSATFDEVKHLPVGYMFLRHGDFRLDPDNPPLARMIAAVPLLVSGTRIDPSDPFLRDADVWMFGHRVLYEWNDADTFLLRGRMAITALGLLLAGALFFWTRAHWGAGPAALAAILCASSPDMLAHGSLATTDLTVTFFFFTTVVAFERLTARVTAWRVLATGVSLGCALTSKHSAMALLPILGILGALAAFKTRTPARVMVVALVLIVIVAGATVWGVYGFRFAPAESGRDAEFFAWDHTFRDVGTPGAVLRAARDLHLLPEAYLYGFADMLRRGQGHPAFLMGERREGTFLWYFPATFALKTPLPLLFLLAAGTAMAFKTGARKRADPFLWIPVLVYVGLAMAHGLNIGHRHLLPIYPFLFVVASSCAVWPWDRPFPMLRRVLPAVAAGACVLAALFVHPHHLSFINMLGGGPSQGYRHFVDSNLDWGQDLKGLKRYADAHPGPRLKLSYFGTADPGYHGIDCDRLPGAVLPAPSQFELVVRRGDRLAVSVTNLQGVYLESAVQPLMAMLRSRRPVASAGFSIFVYDADFDWIAEPEAAMKEGWLEPAIASYQRSVQADPHFADGFGALGEALHLAGRNAESVFAFAGALDIHPDYFGRHPRQAAAYSAATKAMIPAGR